MRVVLQLGRKLHASRSGADDGDTKLLVAQRLTLRIRANARIDQPAMKSLGLGDRFQRDCMFAYAGRPEVVGEAANRDDQRVVTEAALGRNAIAVFVHERRNNYVARPAIEPDHLADSVPKVMPVRLRQVVRLIDADVHAPGGDLVQMRLPEMRALLLDQRDVRFLAPAKLVAELGCKLEAASAASHDDDPMQTGLLGQHALCHRAVVRPRYCECRGLRLGCLFGR